MGEMIGNTNPICPYCSKVLDKMPSRKTKCPHCGNFMYVRTRPVDRQRVLVTERGVQDIDEQWVAIHSRQRAMGFVEEAEFNKEKHALSARFDREPSDQDVLWSLHNQHLIEHARMNNWGLYRNTRLAMAELLVAQEKGRQALDTYLEIAYLDTNGPNNLGGISDPDLLRQFPPFSTDSAFMAPGIVAEIGMLSEKLGLADDDLRDAFLAVAQRVYKNLKLPVAPEESWGRLKDDWAG